MSDTPNNENITLDHCPFCGREPEFILSFDSRTTKYSLQVGCYVCPCKSEAVYFDNKERASDYLDTAAEKWNNRPIEAELERENAELKAEIERLALEIENQQYTITCASEENQQLKESLAEARADADHWKGECSDLVRKAHEMRAEIDYFQTLIDLQHKRTVEADKLWQQAHNQPDVWPDLGGLIEWLLLRLKRADRADAGGPENRRVICTAKRPALAWQRGNANSKSRPQSGRKDEEMSVNNREAYELLHVFLTYCENEHRATFIKEIPGLQAMRLGHKDKNRIIDEFLCGAPLHDINKREEYVANSAREPLEKKIKELETELADKVKQLADARAEIERLREYTTCTLESADAEMDDKDIHPQNIKQGEPNV